MLDLNLFRKEPDAWLFTGVKSGERRQFASVDNSVSQTWPTDSGFTWTIEPLCLYPTPVLESLRIALNHYEQALKASWPEGAKGEAFTHWNKARKALAQQDRKCEAGPSLQDLWDCWDAVHGGKQEPTAWMDAVGDLTFRTPSVKLRPYWTPLYLHPAPIPEGWQLVPKEPTAAMDFAGAKAADEMISANISKLMGPLGGHVVRDDYDDITLAYVNDEISSVMGIYKAMLSAAPKPEELK